MLIAALVMSVHAVVLAVGYGGSGGSRAARPVTLLLSFSQEEPPTALEIAEARPALQAPAEFIKPVSHAEQLASLPVAVPAPDYRPARSQMSHTPPHEAVSIHAAESGSAARPEPSLRHVDAPLHADALPPEQNSGGEAAGKPGAATTGDEMAGFRLESGAGRGTSEFSRIVNAMNPPMSREALKLGKPAYPRACRQGLCRNGRPCEGSSEWKIFVAAAGGKPARVEAVKKMECELQNASIRKFFSESVFPKTNEDAVYLFPVTMTTRQ